VFTFLTELLRSVKSDKCSGTLSPTEPERPEQDSAQGLRPRFRPALERLEDRVTPGGGMWSG
jgi:hypothetical protein